MFGPSKRDLLRLVERERVQHRQEIATLLDRLANASGRPWTRAPADLREPDEPTGPAPDWTWTPEQDPIG